MSLENKVSLVTGAASGIGSAIARRFARAGSFVYVTDVDVDRGEKEVTAIREDGGEAALMELDVSDSDACFRVANQVLEDKGRMDVLVNNAGVGHVGTIMQTTAEDLDRLYAVNVRGVFNVSKAFIDVMIGAGRGSVINIASVGGVVGLTDRLAYTTSKFAVVGMTKSMALDHAKTGVRVNCICPGRVETPFVQSRIQEYPDPDKAYREMADSQPVGRMATPEEIADAALYLARDEAAFVTGSALVIDGALSAGK